MPEPLDAGEFAKLVGGRYGSHIEGGCVNFAVAAIMVLREEGLSPEFIMIGWDHAAVRVDGVEFDGAGPLTPKRVQAYTRKWEKFEKAEAVDDPHHIPLPGRFLTSAEFVTHLGGGGGTFDAFGVTMPLMWAEVCDDDKVEGITAGLRNIVASMR